MSDALALLELNSVAVGLRSLDALVKRARVDILEANLVEPGKFLILFVGGVAEVQEAQLAALEVASDDVIANLLLPLAHPLLLTGLRGREIRVQADDYDCIGVIETKLVVGALHACDRSLKDADVDLTGIRIHGGLGGRAYYVVHGAQHDVEIALEVGKKASELHGGLHRLEIIPRPHYDMVSWLLRPYPFQLK
jgi:microcompartment protein CcmL/EutN